MQRDNERKRRFRSYTVNFSSQKARTTIITMGLFVAVFAIIVSVVAVQLIAGGGQKGLAGRILHSISVNSLHGVISQEIPMYASIGPAPELKETTVSPKGFSNMVLYLFTDIDASNPITLLGFQIPGMAVSDYKLITPGQNYDTPPTDHNDVAGPPNLDAKPREKVEAPKPLPTDKPVIYVYHSHNRESFLPDLSGVTDPDRAYDPEKNIELAGKWLLDGLKHDSINGMQTLDDYWQYNFNDAYDYSRKTVQKVLGEQKNLQLIFDIHRDAGKRQMTTRKVNGQDYAAVYWIIGGANPNSAKNAAVASKLNEYLEQLYPGLSRGVWVKPANPAYDTRYNQDLNSNMVLIEVGGPENSLAEVKRTSDALSKVVSAYLKDGQKSEVKSEPKQDVKQQAEAK